MAEAGPEVPTYEFVHGIETLRHIPNLAHSKEATAVKIPNDDVANPALAHTITYGQLHDLIEQTATALVQTAGIAAGDIVAIAMPNDVEFVLSFLAVPWTRAVSAPLNPNYTESEFEYYMADNRSKCLLVPGGGGSGGGRGRGIPAAEAAATKLGLPVYAVAWDAESMTATLKRVGDDGGDAHGGGGGDNDDVASKRAKPTFEPQPDDVALFLHTSGTTARPKVRDDETWNGRVLDMFDPISFP
jgi:oxalate---CoA ligase